MNLAERRARLRGIYCIVNERHGVLDIAQAALNAGVAAVQYRAKAGIVPENLRALRAMCAERNALLVLNDDWEAAVAYDCDGVHLGPGDAGFAGRRALGQDFGDRVVGLSCGTVEEARMAEAGGADYVGVGPVFPTGSKDDAGEPIGLDGLRRITSATALPVCAIGGITSSNLHEIAGSGAAMAAVISAIGSAPSPEIAAIQLVHAWEANL